MNVAIVDNETLGIRNVYWSPDGSFDESRPDVSSSVTQILVPDTLDYACILAQRDSSENIILIADPVKVQARLDSAWTQMRAERNRRLVATDWVALADAHLSQDRKDAWFAYRQELRDLPDVVTDPMQVEWPLDPTQTPPTPVTGSRLSSLLDAAS